MQLFGFPPTWATGGGEGHSETRPSMTTTSMPQSEPLKQSLTGISP